MATQTTTNSAERPLLRASELACFSGGRRLFERVSLELGAGECVVILGGSGSGKSTLVRLLAGLDEPHMGRVESTKPLSVVLQDVGLFEFDGMTVGENLTLAGGEAASLLDAVGLEREHANRRPAALSGGQRRRVGIARALAASPPAILYDEPTAGLDPETAMRIARLIRQTAEQRSIATLVVTHDMDVAAHVADRILLLPPGGSGLVPVTAVRLPEGPGGVAGLREALAVASAVPPSAPSSTCRPPSRIVEGLRAAVRSLLSPFEALGTAALLALEAPLAAREGSILRRVLTLAPGAVALAVMGSLAVGLVVALQSAAGLGRFEAQYLLPEVAAASLVREVLPLLVGLLLAGRIGAGVAAELGSYSLSGQITMLRLLGKRPERYLAAPLLWAAALVVPLATAAGLAAGLAGLVGGATLLLGLKASLVVDGVAHTVGQRDIVLALTKACVFGFAIAVAGYRHGVAAKRDPAELGEGATRGVVEASMAVVLLDCVISQLVRRG